MKPDDEQLSSLLDEVMSESPGYAGLNRADVLRLVRQERTTRRRRVRVSLAVTALLLLIAFLWQQPSTPAPKPHVATHPPRPSMIRQITDQQLLSALRDTPAALIEWPDGGRTLLVLEPQK